MRFPAVLSLRLAVLLFALVLTPSFGWATATKNCPTEPAQNVPIVSGETYSGSNCTISTLGDVDSFRFSASAGDIWTMAAVMVSGGYPNNVCLALFPPGSSTAIFSGCSDTYNPPNVVSIATTQKLTVTGTYTIVLTETVTQVFNFDLSLERLHPTPADAVSLTLGKTVTGSLTPPTAQDAYTFYGATTGTYEISGSITSGGYPANLCFNVWGPDGTAVVTAACTDTYNPPNQTSVQAKMTPKVNGTYVVQVYEEANTYTYGYSLEVSCYLGTCPSGPPPPTTTCKDAAKYDATTGILTMTFTISTPVAVTWNAWLVSQNTVQTLWSQSQPITEPSITVTNTQALAKAGKVGILSTFTTPTKGITCSSWVPVSTGTP